MRRRVSLAALALLVALPWWVGNARPALAAEQCFAETGHCIMGRFLAYWNAHGGLAINGYPLTEERTEQLENGNRYLVQWFERVRLEYHPENAAPNNILLGHFGRVFRAADPPTGPQQGRRFFPETGHTMGGNFMAYWDRNGGLAQFGFPISAEFTETLDGKPYTVQYTERARFELHPENAAPNNLLLGQFGRQILAGKPTPAACGPLPAPFTGGQTYTDSQGRFTAQFPNGWSARTEADGNVSVVAASGAGVTLAVADAPGRQIDEYKDQILGQVQEPVATNGRFKLLCLARVRVGQYPAYRLRFIHNRTDTPDGRPVPEEIDRIFFLANGRSFNANGFLEPDDDAVRGQIEAVAASIVPR